VITAAGPVVCVVCAPGVVPPHGHDGADYQLVAEVMLFSEGFDQATWLARKMVTLYRLASEQLSQQVRACGRLVAIECT